MRALLRTGRPRSGDARARAPVAGIAHAGSRGSRAREIRQDAGFNRLEACSTPFLNEY